MPPVILDWKAPPDCPTYDQVRQLIEQQQRAQPGTPAQLTARIRITERDSAALETERYAMDLDLLVNAIASHRSLTAESCAAATDAALLMIGLALQPRDEKRDTSPSPATSDDVLRPARFELGASTALLFSTLPGQGWGAMLHFGVAWESLRFIAAVDYYFPRTVERGGARASIDLVSVGFAVCYLYTQDPIALGACGHAEVGQMSGAGSGIDQSSPGSARIQTLGVSWQVRTRIISRIWVFADARVGWNERRPHFTVEGVGLLHAPEVVALRFLLGPIIEME